MEKSNIQKVDTISEYHKLRGLQPPEHPLISLVDYSLIKHSPENSKISWLQKYYTIGLKRNIPGKYRYGQKEYDFDNGLMSFFAPNQILNVEYVENKSSKKPSGWILVIHPDFLWGTSLAGKMKKYEFFSYAINESLFLSEKEEKTILDIFKKIETEYRSNIDDFSQNIIIAQIELLLNYAERFYQRQFITRKKNNHEILDRLEMLLNDYFKTGTALDNGLPSVQHLASQLNLSPGYLSSLTKKLTGQSTQELIHYKLIERAKEKLTTTNLSVSEIAFDLGFEHAQSFNKLFKSKTDYSPLKFREAFYN
ncbi:helix-turn-helix transcriptional regulator [Galbibacter sp. EGI 63066]|uniref:helix-turn-helix domain-containing protein n=1 Tax=Galbibacter sp. EGI 63066 TaxID=2993559 RepID=UPI002249384D|nr:response regulator transcription factor [Galbibacter sp. EGI 63066]MCX2682031.1 helix-turn-helix transcriptional regulator [Galbibacter sp. EGI 63066]